MLTQRFSSVFKLRMLQGGILYIINSWSFLLFLGAADRELFCSSTSEDANTDLGCSCHDPALVGNVQSVEANPNHSPYFIFRGNRVHHCRCRHMEQPKECVAYVDAR